MKGMAQVRPSRTSSPSVHSALTKRSSLQSLEKTGGNGSLAQAHVPSSRQLSALGRGRRGKWAKASAARPMAHLRLSDKGGIRETTPQRERLPCCWEADATSSTSRAVTRAELLKHARPHSRQASRRVFLRRAGPSYHIHSDTPSLPSSKHVRRHVLRLRLVTLRGGWSRAGLSSSTASMLTGTSALPPPQSFQDSPALASKAWSTSSRDAGPGSRRACPSSSRR